MVAPNRLTTTVVFFPAQFTRKQAEGTKGNRLDANPRARKDDGVRLLRVPGGKELGVPGDHTKDNRDGLAVANFVALMVVNSARTVAVSVVGVAPAKIAMLVWLWNW